MSQAAPAPFAAGSTDAGRAMTIATGLAVAAAVAFAASAVTVVTAALLAVLLLWASRDLTGGERRWFWWMSGVALALRFAAVAVLPLLALRSGAFFAAWFGDGYYNIERSMWLRHIFLGVPISPFDFFEAFHEVYGRTRYQFLLAYVHLVFDPSPFGVHLVSTLMYALTVVLLFRLAKRVYGTLPALIALAPLWFFPSLFVWSVSAMKEAEMYFVSVVAVAAVVGLLRGPRWDVRLVSAAGLLIALSALQGLRAGALEIVAGGLAAGLLLRFVTLRAWLVLCALAALPLALWLLTRPAIVARADALVRTAAHRHIGYVWTPGESYRALDEHFYSYDDVDEIRLLAPNAIESMTHLEMARFLIRSAAAFALVPQPWHRFDGRLRWLIPQQMIWYALILLAAPGAVAAWRRDPLVTALMLGMIAAGTAVIAPNSGNIATLMRHRDIVSPFLFVLAGVGAASLLRAATRRGDAWR